MTSRVIAAGLTTTVSAGVLMHLTGTVDPVHQMISDAAGSGPGTLLLGIACAGLVVVAGALAAAARRGRHRRLVPALLAVWAAALVAITIFPTNLPGTELDTAAIIHRYGAALTATVPPIVGLIVARTRRLRTAAWLAGGAAMLFGALHGPAVLLGGDVVPYAGAAERVLFALILVLLALTGREMAVSHSPDGERSVTVPSLPATSMVPDAPPTIAEAA